MEKLLFIYNPHAGKGQVGGKLAGILDAFTKAGCLTTVYPTQGPGDAVKAARELDSDFLTGYARILIDSANLRSAVRTMRMGKDLDFLKLALVSGGGIDPGRIAASSSSGEALAALYANTLLAGAALLGAEAVKGGRMTDFELACDNAVTAYLTKARLVAFGEAPVIAYLAAVEGEITAVRMILTGFLAGIAPDTIRERLREFYA